MVDYSAVAVEQRGQRLSRYQVVGIAVEAALKLAYGQGQRKGICAIQWHNLGDTVSIWDAMINGRRREEVKVKLPREDAELAVKVARQVPAELFQRSFTVMDTVLRHHASPGEHDVVCERFSADGRVEAGVHSVEIKCRCIRTDALRSKVRE